MDNQTKKRVLFICSHNSGRSQIAEALLARLAGDHYLAESAGFEPGALNPVVVQAMAEIDIDISKNKTKSVFDMFKQGRRYDYVIAVCDKAAAEKCPIFPGMVMQRIDWSFEDPAGFQGTHEERLAHTRRLRDQIKEKIEAFALAHTEKSR